MYTDSTTHVIPNPASEVDLDFNDDEFFQKLGYITCIYNYIVYTVLCQLINMFGICTNIINIICFSKQGFNDPVNINLLGLAVADLGSLVTIVWSNVCMTPAFNDLNLPFDPFEIQYVLTGMPHTTFTRISALITASITVERWLCTVMPFKVHRIVTPRSVTAITVSLFIVNLASGSPIYLVNHMGMKYFQQRNKTMLGVIYKSEYGDVEIISYIINNAVFPYLAFFIIFSFTVALAVNMHKSSKWRKTFGSKSIAIDSATIRNQRAVKMVIMISILFIASFTPMCAIFVFMSLNPEYRLFSKYRDVVLMMCGLAELMESVNSSMNIFIYYQMSSNYRGVFHKLFSGRPILAGHSIYKMFTRFDKLIYKF